MCESPSRIDNRKTAEGSLYLLCSRSEWTNELAYDRHILGYVWASSTSCKALPSEWVNQQAIQFFGSSQIERMTMVGGEDEELIHP